MSQTKQLENDYMRVDWGPGILYWDAGSSPWDPTGIWLKGTEMTGPLVPCAFHGWEQVHPEHILQTWVALEKQRRMLCCLYSNIIQRFGGRFGGDLQARQQHCDSIGLDLWPDLMLMQWVLGSSRCMTMHRFVFWVKEEAKFTQQQTTWGLSEGEMESTGLLHRWTIKPSVSSLLQYSS